MFYNHKNIIGIFFFILCFLYAASSCFVPVPPHIEKERHYDGRTIYLSGLIWLSRESPYNHENLVTAWKKEMQCEMYYKELMISIDKSERKTVATFAYMPSLGVISIPLALSSWCLGKAKYFLDIANLLSLILIIFFSSVLIKKFLDIQSVGDISLALGLACLNQTIFQTIFSGQTSLIVLAACLGVFYFAHLKKFFVASLFVVIASAKPQLSLLPILYLLVQTRQWNFWLWSGVLTGITCLSILIIGGTTLTEFMGALIYYKEQSSGPLSGFHSIMAILDLNKPIFSIIFIILGVIFTIILAFLFDEKCNKTFIERINQSKIIRYKINNSNILLLAFIFLLVPTFMPLHSYDLVVIFFSVALFIVVFKWYLTLFLLPAIILVSRIWDTMIITSYFTKIFIPWMLIGTIGTFYLILVLGIIILRYLTSQKYNKNKNMMISHN